MTRVGRLENFSSHAFVYIGSSNKPAIFSPQFQMETEILGVIKGDGLRILMNRWWAERGEESLWKLWLLFSSARGKQIFSCAHKCKKRNRLYFLFMCRKQICKPNQSSLDVVLHSAPLHWRCVCDIHHCLCWSSCMFGQMNHFTHCRSNFSCIHILTQGNFTCQ